MSLTFACTNERETTKETNVRCAGDKAIGLRGRGPLLLLPQSCVDRGQREVCAHSDRGSNPCTSTVMTHLIVPTPTKIIMYAVIWWIHSLLLLVTTLLLEYTHTRTRACIHFLFCCSFNSKSTVEFSWKFRHVFTLQSEEAVSYTHLPYRSDTTTSFLNIAPNWLRPHPLHIIYLINTCSYVLPCTHRVL